MSIFPTDEEIIEGLKNRNEELNQRVAELKQALANTMNGKPTQTQIKMRYDVIYGRLKQHRKNSARKEREIIDEWRDLQELCSHPNLQGNSEGYCPDCGYTFG